MNGSELTPQHVLMVLFDSDDFPVAIPNPEEAAEIVVRRLIDSGFVIKDQEEPDPAPPGCQAPGAIPRRRAGEGSERVEARE